MKFRKDPVYGFTTRATGIARELKNEIFVSEAYNPQSGMPEPTSKKFICVWDTGATNTVITKNVIDALGLKPSGRGTVKTVGPGAGFNEYEVDTYLLNLRLPNSLMVAGVPASEGGLADADVLLGMDIIAMGDFAITNCDGQTCWTFRMPSVEGIDFVAEINEHNRKYKHLLITDDQKRMERNRAKRARKRNR